MNFVALDFETANADLSSVCQVGIVVFEGGKPVSNFVSLVDPESFFDGINISIHGLDEEAVRGAPTFPNIHGEIASLIGDRVVVCHTPFDRLALNRAESRYALDCVQCQWLDTARVARRAWPRYARAGYGLANLALDFGITLKHHDAAEDALAAGMILVRAIHETGISLNEWLVRVIQPVGTGPSGRLTRDGNPAGPLYGEVVVFTGALLMVRHEAADLAAAMGCRVDEGVTKNTTLLIVGDQDVARLSDGQTRSNKHQKAEALIAKGQAIRILRETDFRALCA